MEYGNPRAKIIGFITVLLILIILSFMAFKMVDKNKKEALEESKTVTYQEKNIDIFLNGDYVEYIKKGKTYTEKGVKAVAKDGTDLSETVVISYFKDNRQVSKIDTSILGSYLVKYTVINPSTNKYLAAYKTVIITKK